MSHAVEPLQNLFIEVAQSMQLSCTLPQHLFASSSHTHRYQTPTNNVMAQLQAILQSANKVRDVCAASIPLSQEDNTESDIWDAAHAKQARAWVEDSLSRVRDHINQPKSNPVSEVVKVKPVFNHEYTPLLDKYFEYNAYPSAPDRAILARKSMMTPRQIEVWFQNHRNRARKEGKVLRRLTKDSYPHEISLKSVEDKMAFFVIPEPERKVEKESISDADDSDKESTPPMLSMIDMTPNALNPARSSVAFPTPYAHRSKSLSFPVTLRTYTFPPPIWYRKPAVVSQLPTNTNDMSELTLHFNQKLHLRAPVSRKGTRSWCSERVTIPCPAPHPALVRKSQYLLPESSAKLRLPASLYKPYVSSQGFTAVSSTSDETLSRRKVACLPKRRPQGNSITHCRGSLVASSSSSRSSSATSRSLSTCSSMCSERRSVSTSRSLSSGSPCTPLLPHSSLPEISPSIYVSNLDPNSVQSHFSGRGAVSLAVDTLHEVFPHPKLRMPLMVH